MTAAGNSALPPETVHLPFEPGPHRMAMGLFTVPQEDWFEINSLYPKEMAQRRDLLARQHAAVFAATPRSAAAQQEALTTIVENLTAYHPTWFTRRDNTLHNNRTGEIWQLTNPGCDALECAGRLVQEDLCLIQSSSGGPLFTAGVLCFPSRWSLLEKIGKPLGDVHGSVPLYAEHLSRAVDRLMRHVRPGHIVARRNWSVLDDPALFQPGGKWRQAPNDAITADNAGDALFLRVERQTLVRLPASDAVLFGIRVHNYRLNAVLDASAAERLAQSVRSLPAEVMHYKSMTPFRAALLAWLDRRAVGRAPDVTDPAAE